MTPALRWSILVTDLAFLAYWSVSLAALCGIIGLPPELMYRGYDQPRVIAWNWSFLPLDLGFSFAGLAAVAAARRGHRSWRSLAIISLCFTMAAGGLAVTYWSILQEYDPAWFLPNLAILLWPLFFLPRLVRPKLESEAN